MPKPTSQWARLGDYYAEQKQQQDEINALAAEVATREGVPASQVRARWHEQALAETVDGRGNTGGEWGHVQRASKHLVTVAQREAEHARQGGE